jgi:hypothetical protein
MPHRMSLLKNELKLPDKAIRLLEAIDHAHPAVLAEADAVTLRKKVAAANGTLQLYKKIPALKQIESWILSAKAHHREEESSPDPQIHTDEEAALVNFENDPDVLDMIALSPLAIPLPGKTLAEMQVPVQEIPVAILLTAARGDVSIRASAKSPEKRLEKTVIKTPVSSTGSVNTISFGQKREQVNMQRIRSTDEFTNPRAAKVSREEQKNVHEDRVRILRTALPETNAGVDPQSRRYIRGVLHTHPGQLWWGALITIVCHALIPLGIVAAIALLLKDNGSASLQWLPGWILVFPLGVFFFGLLFFIISFHASCRICGQKCFMPKKCLKSEKAHRLPLLGYVLSVALHMLIFRWFRCSFCGTPVRLKR